MGRGYLNDRASGCERLHPFPWRGEGPWVGVEASPYEIALPRQTGEPEGVRWEWLESPSRRLGIIDIRGFILCVAQFVTRKNQKRFWFFARLIVSLSSSFAIREKKVESCFISLTLTNL